MKVVEVSAPATIANLGPGFDIVGMAIEGFRDIVRLELAEKGVLELEVVNEAGGHVSANPRENSAVVSAVKVLEYAGVDYGVRMRLVKNVPVGIGLGSSGASAAAAAYAANKALGEPLPMEVLVRLAAEGERVACGSPHLDNVAPSLYGGFTMILDVDRPKIYNIKPSLDFSIVLVTPKVSLPRNKTEYARGLLPVKVDLGLMVKQQTSLTKLIVGLLTNDLRMLGEAVSSDHIVEPARSVMIPHFNEVKRAALEAGALGFSISGAGPSVFALTYPEDSHRILQTLVEKFREKGVEAKGTVTRPTPFGARLERA